jgi:integrase
VAAERFIAHPRHPLTGRQFTVSGATERELQARLHHVDQLRSGLHLGTTSEDEVDQALRRLVHGRVSLERIATAYVGQAHLSPNTRANIAAFVRGPAAELRAAEFSELSAGRVAAWLSKLAGAGASPSTVDCYWRRLSSLARFAAGREWIGRLPWGAYKPTFRGRRASRTRESARDLVELARLFEAARALDQERLSAGLLPDIEAKITVGAALGLRQGELAGLRWSDVSAERLQVTIARQWDGERLPKGGQKKTLTAVSELFDLLAEHRKELARRGLDLLDGPVFPNPKTSRRGAPRAYAKGECLTRRILRAVVTRAQLPDPKAWSPHSLRDTFASLEQRTSPDLSSLAQRTRHQSLSSLLRYLRAGSREPPPPGFALPPAGVACPRLSESNPDPK